MWVQRLTTSAISSSSTSSLSIRWPFCRSASRASSSLICCSSCGQPAVLQLGRLRVVAGLLRPLHLQPHLLEFFLAACGRPGSPPSPAASARPAGSCSSLRSASSFSSFSSRSFDALSVSLRSASRSISSCMMRRSTSSSSAGIESISMRSRDAASSIRSMALSGRNRSVM